jgi:hypothetical protein
MASGSAAVRLLSSYDAAIMMARVQVSLSTAELRRARARASELGISFAEYVRRLVARDLGEGRRSADPHALFDLGDSGGSDVARDKRRYVGEAVEAAR